MSIPDFNLRGVLQRGIHKCTPKEFIERFCYEVKTNQPFIDGTIRASYLQVINQLFGHSIERGARSIIFGGSFITNTAVPNDIDCIVIVPHKSCIPTKTDIVILSDCRLDVVYALEEDKKMISNMINMFARDMFEMEVGLVEVILDEGFDSTWDYYYGDCDFDELIEERKAYLQRHIILGSKKRGVLVTIHGINTYAEWNNELAPIASSNNWIFAPFYYGNVKIPLFNTESKKQIIERFRIWIHNLYEKYKIEPTIFAHSFGTYILGQYITGFNYTPPVRFKSIVLAGSILNSSFDWISGFKKNCYTSVLNIVSPNDPWVPEIKKIKWIHNDKLYGTASNDGFIQKHPRLLSEKVNIYDHGNMLKTDVFESRIIPFLNMVNNFEIYGYNQYISDNAIEKMKAGIDFDDDYSCF